MASDDEMRAKLTKALDSVILGPRSIRILGSDSCPTGEGVDALMPVIREALADAWDAGWESGCHYEHDNPWREDQP